MFRQMRRKKQELTQEECVQILDQQPRGFLAVWGDDDYPYTIPINYVYNNNKIYLHSALEGQLTDSIKKSDKVTFSVINDGEKVENEWWYIFKSVIIFGRIKIIEEKDEKIKQLIMLGNKYFPTEEYTLNVINRSVDRTQVLEISIEHMTGKIVTEK